MLVCRANSREVGTVRLKTKQAAWSIFFCAEIFSSH